MVPAPATRPSPSALWRNVADYPTDAFRATASPYDMTFSRYNPTPGKKIQKIRHIVGVQRPRTT